MILCEWDAPKDTLNSVAYTCMLRILSTSFIWGPIFSVCCYSSESISVVREDVLCTRVQCTVYLAELCAECSAGGVLSAVPPRHGGAQQQLPDPQQQKSQQHPSQLLFRQRCGFGFGWKKNFRSWTNFSIILRYFVSYLILLNFWGVPTQNIPRLFSPLPSFIRFIRFWKRQFTISKTLCED